MAVGVGLGVACAALTAGAGAVGCAMAAGAISNMVTTAIATPPDQWSAGGFAASAGIGAASGLIGFGVGAGLGKVATVVGKAVRAGGGSVVSKAGGQVAKDAVQGAETAAEGVGASTGRTAAKGVKPGCFVAGTKVLMGDGSRKAIEKVKVGDRVTSKNLATGALEIRRVTRLYRHENVPTYRVATLAAGGSGVATATGRTGKGAGPAGGRDSTGSDTTGSDGVASDGVASDGAGSVVTTAEHPFWVVGIGWVLAAALQPGQQLVQDNGRTVTIDDVRPTGDSTTVYNFEVEDNHNYFVAAGDAMVLVHNSCGTNEADAGPAVFRTARVGKGHSELDHGLNPSDFSVGNRSAYVGDESAARSLANPKVGGYENSYTRFDMHPDFEGEFAKFKFRYPEGGSGSYEYEIPQDMINRFNELTINRTHVSF